MIVKTINVIIAWKPIGRPYVLEIANRVRLVRARGTELGWFILFPTVSSPIQVTKWPRTGTTAQSQHGICKTGSVLAELD